MSLKLFPFLIFSITLYVLGDPANAQQNESSAKWLRSSYSNSIKTGGIGVGVAVASKSASSTTQALCIELLALQPVKIDASSPLRVVSNKQLLLELPAAITPWPVSSSVGSSIKGKTAYTSRQCYPLSAAQRDQIAAASKPVLQIAHEQGMQESKLSSSEQKALRELQILP